MNNHTIDNHNMDNHPMSNHAIENHTIENHTIENHTIEHHSIESHTIEGHTIEGPTIIETHSLNNHAIENAAISSAEEMSSPPKEMTITASEEMIASTPREEMIDLKELKEETANSPKDDTMDGTPKKKAKKWYQQAFKQEWLHDPRLKDWLQEEGGCCFCIVCNSKLKNANKSMLLLHSKTTKHKRNMDADLDESQHSRAVKVKKKKPVVKQMQPMFGNATHVELASYVAGRLLF